MDNIRHRMAANPTKDAAESTSPSNNTGTASSGVGNKVTMWQTQSDQCQKSKEENPFSAQWKGPTYVTPRQGDSTYGRPPEGSKTEYRGKQAGVRISTEVVELCQLIQQLGQTQPNGTVTITFGYLFETYTRISNKLVGMLLRARKQCLIKFEGEMLFQRRDDDTVITLLQSPDELKKDIEQRQGELSHHATKTKN